jgi:hypothetical protein
MSGLFNANVGGFFQVVGEVVAKRYFKSEKSGRETWYVNVAGKGETYEVQIQRADYDQLVPDQGVKIIGKLTEQFSKLVLVADKVEPVAPMSTRAAS